MIEFSVFPLAFRMGTQNWNSNFHNFVKWGPIQKWDISLSLWLSSLFIYVH